VYTLRIKDSGFGGCDYDTTFNVPGDAPLRFVHSTVNSICFGEALGSIKLSELNGTGPIKITVRNANTEAIVKVDSVTGAFFFNSEFTITEILAGEYNVTVEQYGRCAASRTFSVSITQPEKIVPTARTYRKTSPDFAKGALLLENITGGVGAYTVDFPGLQPFEFTTDTLFGGLLPEAYTITITDGNGCVVDTTLSVEADFELMIPNLVTPNGDGKNDRWIISNLKPGSKVRIVNRWGKEVYSSNDYKNDWEPKDLQPGSYFYNFTAPGEKTLTGWVDVRK
jgi:gliding motility-associated-like protein